MRTKINKKKKKKYFSQFNSIPEIYYLWNKIKELNGTLLIAVNVFNSLL